MEKVEERKQIIEQLLLNLQVLSNINKWEKISIKNNTELDVDKRYLQSFRRYFSGDSREQLLNFLHVMFVSIDTEIDFLISLSQVDNINVNEYVVNTLHDFYLKGTLAKNGLVNLIETYNNDTYIKSKLELYNNILDRKVNNIKRRLKV